MTTRPAGAGARGFAMMEVLVTLVIVLLGMLGAAGVLVMGHQSSVEAYQRTQALVLIEDMFDRIKANHYVASCYAVTEAASGAPQLGTGFNGALACGSGTPDQQATAISDLQQWSDLLKGAAEKDSADSSVGAMIGARGCVSFDAGTQAFTVTVVWQGLGETVAPPDSIPCGRGLYGNDAQRRAASVSLQFANI
jgi:type IV pilus assembly protein PilV